MGKVIIDSSTSRMMPMLVSHPVVLVGANVDEKPNFATVAWVGVAASKPPAISISLQHHRYTLKGIRQNMTFSVNIPSTDLITETDYCGLVSGSKTDKVSDTNFKILYGSVPNAPFIEQCPVNHACEVIQILNLGSHELIIGKIVESYISENCLKDGQPNIRKIKPFAMTLGKYTAIGRQVGNAFRSGRVIAPEKAEETVRQFRNSKLHTRLKF